MTLRKTTIAAVLSAVLLASATAANAQQPGGMMGGQGAGPAQSGPGMMGGYGGYGMGPGHMGGFGGYGMGPGMMGGYGGYGMGPGMMGGYGMGQGMMGGYGMGPGMMGGYGMGPGMMGGYGMGPGMMGGYGGSGMGAGMMGGYGANMADALGLTAEQREKITKIQETLSTKHWDLMGRIQEQQFKLRELLASEKADDASVGKAYKRVVELRQQMWTAALEVHKQMDAVLTQAQRDQLQRGWRHDGR